MAPHAEASVTSQDDQNASPPAGALGPADVMVIPQSLAMRLRQASPTSFATSLGEPEVGTTEGGTPIVIDGAGFGDDSTVKVGGSVCTAVNVVSATRITCTTPAHSPGAVAVVVTTK